MRAFGTLKQLQTLVLTFKQLQTKSKLVSPLGMVVLYPEPYAKSTLTLFCIHPRNLTGRRALRTLRP
jgi:hypothetical protein